MTLITIGLYLPVLRKYIKKRRFDKVNVILTPPDDPPEKFDEDGNAIPPPAPKFKKYPSLSVPPMWSWRKGIELVVAHKNRAEVVPVRKGRDYDRFKKEVRRYGLAYYATKEANGHYYVSISESDTKVNAKADEFIEVVDKFNRPEAKRKGKAKAGKKSVLDAFGDRYPKRKGRYDMPTADSVNWKEDVKGFCDKAHLNGMITFIKENVAPIQLKHYARDYGYDIDITSHNFGDEPAPNGLWPMALHTNDSARDAIISMYKDRGKTNRDVLYAEVAPDSTDDLPY